MKRLALCLVFLLAACSGPQLPFEKQAASDSDAVKPPWEALVKAGPGAENDLDLETLDGPLLRPTLDSVPPPAQDSTAADAPLPEAAAEADAQVPGKGSAPEKKGTVIKAVAVPLVTGAKGKGNSELTEAMRQVLKEAGWPVLAGRREDALLITGKVTLLQPSGDSQTVKLVWTVAGPDGKVLGQIAQENAVPAGSLNSSWGENAQYASEAAAEGIFKLIQGYR